MENENKIKEPVNPYKKSKDIVITRSQLKKIVAVILALVCILLVTMYFNSGLTHRRAKQEFSKYWSKTDESKLQEIKILGIKKLKTDTFWVKISSTCRKEILVDINGKQHIVWSDSKEEKEKEIEERGLTTEFRSFTDNDDYIFTKWDTGWFIEKKKK